MRALTAGSVLALAAADTARQVAAARRGVLRVGGLTGSIRSLLIAAAAQEADRVLVLVADETTATAIRKDLQTLLLELATEHGRMPPELLPFPALEADPYQGIGSHPQVQAERAGTLWRLRRASRWVSLVPSTALFSPLLPVDRFEALCLRLRQGETRPFESLAGDLDDAGYQRVDMASSVGDWARRGGIFDVYPPGRAEPLRIELDDDRIASLRIFDPLTQRSLEERAEVEIPPAREAPLTAADRELLVARLERMPRTGGRSLGTDPLESLVVEGSFPGLEATAGLWAGRETDLLHYAGDDTLLVLDEPFRIETELTAALTELAAGRDAAASPLPPPERLLLPPAMLHERLQGPRLELHELGVEPAAAGEDHELVEIRGRAPRSYFGRLPDLVQDIRKATAAEQRILILLESDGLLDRLREVLEEDGLNPAVLPATVPAKGEIPWLALAKGRLSQGFELPEVGLTVLTGPEIFGESRRKRPRGGRRAAPFRSDFRDLAVGDLVVHIDHGIGRYQGIRRLQRAGGEDEFMILVYRGETVLYVPVDRLDLVQKYSGAGNAPPRLDRIGAAGWKKVRSRIRKEMQDLAAQLLELYAARRALPGRAAGPDTPWQKEFEAAFPFEETPDQAQAIEEVRRDMESTAVMDRLLCGDVGFGKTEVAMRAAFKAVMDGTQVAILAPTTVLVFQHFNTFRARFAPFPVEVDMLSRFRSRAEQTATVKQLRDGGVDIIIGTHRLLSKDIAFKNLGLLVVDEEQRFGVAHKERLKSLRQNVDVLTLTATPIPRTLQMSLAGVRDLSVIETPPENRMAIQTQLLPFRTGIAAQAIRREIRRGGQVFLVHNRVGSIAAMAAVIRREVPEVTLEVAHGQMDEKRLESVMLRFIAGEFELLLTTSIIENGLDIPRANTIIINRADRFGLAELYQLRGRVGRSDVRAYAYLMIPSQKKLSNTARRRLKALQEFTELGSGFRIAARDLEIRGAGEMLGPRQHGQIAALGFDLYCRMLEQAVREKKGEAPPPPEVRIQLDLNVEFRLPDDYVTEAHQRLVLYKRVAAAAEAGELDRVKEEIEDAYGHLPQEVENLLALASIRTRAERLGIVQLLAADHHIQFHFVDPAPVDPKRLLAWVQSNREVSLSGSRVLSVPASEDPDLRLDECLRLLELLERMVTPAIAVS